MYLYPKVILLIKIYELSLNINEYRRRNVHIYQALVYYRETKLKLIFTSPNKTENKYPRTIIPKVTPSH